MPKILKAKDAAKDQSYFLWQIKKEQLDKILFPVGEFENKAKVREFAQKHNLLTAQKKDSQGLCFVGQTSLAQMLLQTIGQKLGLIINQTCPEFKPKQQLIEPQSWLEILEILANLSSKANKKQVLIINWEILTDRLKQVNQWPSSNKKVFEEIGPKKTVQPNLNDFEEVLANLNQNRARIFLKKTGKEFYQILGLHSGAFLYTVGQRQNLNLSGGPWFVTLTDTICNLVVVTDQTQPKLTDSNSSVEPNLENKNQKLELFRNSMYCTKILVKNLNWQQLSTKFNKSE